jgi:hypothetical protein
MQGNRTGAAKTEAGGRKHVQEVKKTGIQGQGNRRQGNRGGGKETTTGGKKIGTGKETGKGCKETGPGPQKERQEGGNGYRRQGGVKETTTRGIMFASQQSRSRLCNKEVEVISHLTIRGQKGEGLFQVLNSTLVMPGIAFSLLKNI